MLLFQLRNAYCDIVEYKLQNVGIFFETLQTCLEILSSSLHHMMHKSVEFLFLPGKVQIPRAVRQPDVAISVPRRRFVIHCG